MFNFIKIFKKVFPYEVQFGHAGALALGKKKKKKSILMLNFDLISIIFNF